MKYGAIKKKRSEKKRIEVKIEMRGGERKKPVAQRQEMVISTLALLSS